MRFDRTDLNPGVWFYFKDEPVNGGICLRRVSAAKMSEIHKQTRKTKVEFRRGRRYESVQIDEDKEDLLLWDYCIADWQGLEDEFDDVIEPTAENKRMLMSESPDFAAFVTDCLEQLDGLDTNRKEKEAKNS